MAKSPSGNGSDRREPTFDARPEVRAPRDLRVSAEDRPGYVRPGAQATPRPRPAPAPETPRRGERIEPAFEEPTPFGPHADYEAEPDFDAASYDAPQFDSPGADDMARAAARRSPKSKRSKRPRRRRSVVGTMIRWTFALGVWAIIAVGGVIGWYAMNMPAIHNLEIPPRPPNVLIVAANGTTLANRGETGGRAVKLAELPPYLPKAFVAIEDRRFYEHLGIDPIGLARAVFENLRRGGLAQGGSTLTQQLAKNLFLTPERSLERKIQEVVLALWLESKFSKDEILELYLNRVYFGAGAYGVEAASRRYFGKPARDVTLGEAAILAGLVKAPTRLAPTRDREAAEARAQLVLAAMAEQGLISDADAKRALSVPAMAKAAPTEGSTGYVADWVMDQIDSLVGTYDKDIIVDTTIDPRIQASTETALTEVLDTEGKKYGAHQGAVVVMEPLGAVKALVGGRSYAESQYNRAVTAKRQPGSSFKPFVYLAALEQGLTPESVRVDEPINIKGWSPGNSDNKFRGPVTLTQALAFSINTVAVRLALEVGPDTVVKTAERLGIHSPLQANASIALGTSEVAPIEMASAYATFANGGYGVLPYVIKRVRTSDGETLYQRAGSGLGQVVAPEYVGMMNAMLQQTLTIGTARKAKFEGWQAAGKTGTTNDYKDAWFVGYTASLVGAVWVGNDDATSTKRAAGANLPVDIWSRVMTSAHEGMPIASLPGNYTGESAFEPVSAAVDPGPFAGGRDDGRATPVAGRTDGWTPPSRRGGPGLLERLFGG